jgi:hypothetical protein
MDMRDARDIAVRFLGGLPVSDDDVFEASNTIRANLRENGLLDEDLDVDAEVPALVADYDVLDDVRTLRLLVS